MYLLILSLTSPPPPRRPLGTFWNGEFSIPRAQKGGNPDPLDREIVLKPHPQGNYFKKSSKKSKHETEIMKNSTEMLICLDILKHWNI